MIPMYCSLWLEIVLPRSIRSCWMFGPPVPHQIGVTNSSYQDDIWANLGREGSRGYFFLCGSKQPEKEKSD